ncbi:TetR/AcrR family transcriptional regulator [Micromonospora chokoriensis]
MRADARKNYDQLIAVARTVVTADGAGASMRDIARRAGVGLGTMQRHFPTREALLEALLRTSFDGLTTKAGELETSDAAGDALVWWLRDFVAMADKYQGVITAMVAALEDPESALHASCTMMKAAGARLLARAQVEGTVRADIDATDLYALGGALAWVGDQPALAPRVERLFTLIVGAIMTNPAPGR